MTTLATSDTEAPAPTQPGAMVLTDINGHGAWARRSDGTRVPLAVLLADAHYMGTTETVDPWPSYADRDQLARVIAGLLDIGTGVFGEDFHLLVARYGDPNDDMGSGVPELGGYRLED